MAKTVLNSAKVWLGGYDVSGDLNAFAFQAGADLKDSTSFGSGGWRERLGGMKHVDAQLEGMVNAGAGLSDAVLFASVGATAAPMSAAPSAGAAGTLAYFFLATTASYAPGGSVGELHRFSLAAEGGGAIVSGRDQSPLFAGTILHNGTVTATGNGTSFNLGDVITAGTVHAAIHVLAVSGTNPTLDVIVQSGTTSGIPTPAARITFAQKTAIGSEFKSSSGGIGDSWWRVNYTVGGTGSPSFAFVVVVNLRP